ncbi:unnamed protein product [Microthlaspi erraticum]|uniref:Transposase MuDR plant domain-containing protein n=1 Tax=Microthlaspi erraticum TaxID=1685480 RepID=A0A6D2JB43_9BRAS|nr:unnamed protein product [Microthlaspi erraticum]
MFRFKYHQHEKCYIVATCINPRCDWRVTACNLGNSQTYDLRKANLKHTCDADSRRTFSKVIAALLRTKYETTVGPRPKDLPYSLRREHHINASYWKCWKERVGNCICAWNRVKLLQVATIVPILTEVCKSREHYTSTYRG